MSRFYIPDRRESPPKCDSSPVEAEAADAAVLDVAAGFGAAQQSVSVGLEDISKRIPEASAAGAPKPAR